MDQIKLDLMKVHSIEILNTLPRDLQDKLYEGSRWDKLVRDRKGNIVDVVDFAERSKNE